MTPSEPAFLKVENLIKYYEGKPLIMELSFSVFNQEILCLLGPSGSGKSTLLRIIAGLESFEGGRVSWRGKDLVKLPPEQRSFGLMFQDYALFPHLTVFENVAFGLRMQQLPDATIELRVSAELERVRMSDFAKRKVQNLSGGEQQRIALARTLAPKPKLIMLDEPLGALDRKLREQLTQEVRLILKSIGAPVIYVTHDQDEAFSLADRILILSEGRIMQLGTPEEIYQRPDSCWISNFLGLGTVTRGELLDDDPLLIRTVIGEVNRITPPKKSLHGSLLNLLIRPTDVVKVNMHQSGITGNVRDCIFQGDHYRTEVDVNGETFIVFLPDYSKPGDQIKLALLNKPITILKSDND